MARGDPNKKPVAFVITITGIIDVDYEEGNLTPAQEFNAAYGVHPYPSAAVEVLMRDASEMTFIIRADGTRNFPNNLGGHYMKPEDETIMCRDCGRIADHPSGECG